MIMAGGGGTRFWPRSRNARPKQFLTFTGERTLLQSTWDRIAPIVPAERTWVMTGSAYTHDSAEQLPELPRAQIVGEPCRRDTAPCVGLAAALIARTDPDATIIVMPADHVIEPEREFQRAVLASEQFAEEFPEALFTFGIRPTFPSTGYGYIHRGPIASERNGIALHSVQSFTEKPMADTAERFLHSGDYEWNSGIFVWKARTILQQLQTQRPDLAEACATIANAWGTPNQEQVFHSEYDAIRTIGKGNSIDYAVMENAPKRMMLRAPYQWDDVGSWLALERHNPQDAVGNTVQGKHIAIDTTGCIVSANAGQIIATIGVSDLVIIQDGNATLVVRKADEGRVKEIVDQLKAQKLEGFL